MENSPEIKTDKIDRVTFEVLRHRLWEINDEMGLIAGQISGSPAVYESGDFNTAILTADGKGFKEPVPAELPDLEWRADPADGLRPFKHVRESWTPA